MSTATKEFYLFTTIMSLVMSGGMSLVMTLNSVGVDGAFTAWPGTWFISFLVALPMSIIVVPITKRAVEYAIRLMS